VPALLNNYGTNGESETLWLTGFPVYDQATTVKNFQLLDVGGAYQVAFNKPIQFNATATGAGSPAIGGQKLGVRIRLLGQNWTIVTGYGAGAATVNSSYVVAGGQIQLASSSSPVTTVYLGNNMTSGPFAVQLQDLGYPNSNGISPVRAVNAYPYFRYTCNTERSATEDTEFSCWMNVSDIDETRNILTIENGAQEKNIPKSCSSFMFILPDTDGKRYLPLKIKVDGRLLLSQPENRIQTKFRKKFRK